MESQVERQNYGEGVDPGLHPALGEPTRPRVAALVPAYNEAGRIGKVIATLCQVGTLSEIIVVDDGSKDATSEEARRAAAGDPRLRVIRHSINQGKGQAVFTGLAATRAPLLLLLDADLINLKPKHVQDLMEPVLSGEADMTLGLFKAGNWRTDAAHWLTPWLTGQRTLRTALLNQMSLDAAAGYGFETALTLAAHHDHWRQKRVPLVGVTHVPGDVPRGSWRGPANKVKMYAHIVRAWFLAGYWRGFLPQVLRRLRLALFLMVTLGLSLVNSCSLSTSNLHNRFLMRWMSDETVWQLWGKLKAAIDFLQ